MRFSIVSLLIFLLTFQGLCAQEMNRRFPYHASLQGTSAPSNIVEKIPSGAPTGSNRYTDEGLRLTHDDTKFSMSGFYLKDIEVPLNYDIEVDFKFATLDGSEYNGKYGDGITLFFFDSEASFDLGSKGSGLGYAYNNASGNKQPGLNGAYLGVGLDVFGDSKTRMNAGGVKREGISGVTFKRYDSHITIRGGQYQNDRYKGYPVIFSEQTEHGSPSRPDTGNVRLDYETGEYEEDAYASSKSDLRTEYANQLNFSTFRFVYNSIHNDGGGPILQFYLRSHLGSISGGNSKQIKYPNSFRTKDENGSLYTFKNKDIDSYRIGLVATTGDATQTHIIKDVNVRLTHAPVTKDKKILLCLTEKNNGDDRESWVKLEKPFDGAVFYIGDPNDPGRPKWGNTFREIDFNSVRLEDEYGYPLDYSIVQTPNYLSQIYDEPGVGEWDLTYNEFSATLYFTPAKENMPEGDYDVYISAKSLEKNDGSPFAEEDYRSRPTKVTVQAKYCKAVVNPSMPIRVMKIED